MGKNAIDQMNGLLGDARAREQAYTRQAQSLADVLVNRPAGQRTPNPWLDILGYGALGTAGFAAGPHVGTATTAAGLGTGIYKAITAHPFDNPADDRLKAVVDKGPILGKYVPLGGNGLAWSQSYVRAMAQARNPGIDLSTKTSAGQANNRALTQMGNDLDSYREGGGNVYEPKVMDELFTKYLSPQMKAASEQARQAKEEVGQLRRDSLNFAARKEERAEDRAADMAKLARSEALQREEIALRRESLAMERERLSRGPEESRIAGIYNMAASLAAAAARGI